MKFINAVQTTAALVFGATVLAIYSHNMGRVNGKEAAVLDLLASLHEANSKDNGTTTYELYDVSGDSDLGQFFSDISRKNWNSN